MRRRLVRATARVPKPALDHKSVVLTARRCVSWSSHAVCGALSGGESELSLSVATHEGFRGWTTVSARGQCREILGDLQGIVLKKTRVPQRTAEPASEQIVHDGARLARIKPRRRRHAAPRPVRQCSGVGGRFFADGDIGRFLCRLDIISGTATRRRRCSSVAARPRHPAMARNRRIGRGRLESLLEKSADCQHGRGGEALVTSVLEILLF